MISLESFKKHKISNLVNVKGGEHDTGPGTRDLGNGIKFEYGFDTSTWEAGADKWTIQYYNVSCGC